MDVELPGQLSKNKEQISSFLVVGAFGNLIGWAIYSVTYYFVSVDNYRPTISWVISFHFGVILQHILHRKFTFKESIDSYLHSLFRTYISYIGVLIFGLLVNFYLNEILNLYHHLSWIITLVASIPLSFLLLKKFAFYRDESGSSKVLPK